MEKEGGREKKGSGEKGRQRNVEEIKENRRSGKKRERRK